MSLLTAGLISAGAGIIGKAIGGFKAAKGAKKLDALGRDIPQAEKSQYIPQLVGATQLAINSNPLYAATQRRNQAMTANTIYNARQLGDPSQIMGLLSASYGQASDNELKAQMGDEQLREQRRGAYYNALQSGAQEENNYFDRRMANVQTRGNLLQAATKQRAEVWNGLGSDLIGAGGTMATLGMYNTPKKP